jgi:P22 coat protein - gene protein 5
MANTLITPTWVLKDVARVAVNLLKFASQIERWYDDKYKVGGAKAGYTVSGRLPQRFRTTKGQAFQAQPINDQVVPVTLTDQANIATAWSTADATMVIEDVRRRYVNPAAEQLANTIDFDGLNRLTPTVWKSVGSPGVTPSSRATFLNAGARMTKVAVPMDARVAVLDPLAMVGLVNDSSTLFNPSAAVSEQYRSGQFGRNTLGFSEWYQDQNIYTHVTGSFASSTPVVSGANQTGTSLTTSGWATATLNKGDVFTIAGVYEVNPQNYASTGQLQQFVVTNTVTDTAGTMVIPISPAIIPDGNLQTVTNSPANSAPIVVLGSTLSASVATGTMAAQSSPQSLLFHPEAFVLAMADLDAELPGAEVTRVADNELNVSLRYVRQYHIGTDQKMARIDALYGFKDFRPDWAVRVWG